MSKARGRVIGEMAFTTAAAAGAIALVFLLASRNHAQDGGGATVFTANAEGSSASVLDGGSLQQAHADVGPISVASALALSPDQSRVYVVGGDFLTAIDATTFAILGSEPQSEADSLTDVVASPDGTKVYATARQLSAVVVADAGTLQPLPRFDLPSVSSNSPEPQALDVLPDGSALFVLLTSDSLVLKISTANGAELDRAVVGISTELRVSVDGTRLVVVGGNGSAFFSTDTLDPVDGADLTFRGRPVDAAAAGSRFYVLDGDAVDFGAAGKRASGPKGKFNHLGPAIHVYDQNGTFLETHALGGGANVKGIAVTSDGSAAYVSRDSSESSGEVIRFEFGGGGIVATGTTGDFPRRVVVREIVNETPVDSYFLPRAVNVKIAGAGKDGLGASGFYDVGSVANVDYGQPVTIQIGSYQKTFTLIAKGAGFVSPKDPSVTFSIGPNLKGSSRGKFKMKVKKATLGADIDVAQPVSFHFSGTGLADAAGTIKLTAGRYKLGKQRGALVSPFFFPQKAKARVAGDNADSFSFTGGFSTNGQTPAQLGTVRFGFGPVFSRSISGNQFTKKGDVFSFTSKQGSTTFTMRIDFLREVVTVSGKKVELGGLNGPTTDFVFDAGSGAGTFRNTVRLGASGAARGY